VPYAISGGSSSCKTALGRVSRASPSPQAAAVKSRGGERWGDAGTRFRQAWSREASASEPLQKKRPAGPPTRKRQRIFLRCPCLDGGRRQTFTGTARHPRLVQTRATACSCRPRQHNSNPGPSPTLIPALIPAPTLIPSPALIRTRAAPGGSIREAETHAGCYSRPTPSPAAAPSDGQRQSSREAASLALRKA
jgi:hypothetical protein